MSHESQSESRTDHWNSEAYSAAASFVPQLTTKVLQYLEPQSHESILDLGCGDGTLTATIAARCQSIVGLDSSASFIRTANEKVAASHGSARFFEHDCRRLYDGQAISGHILADDQYDKVFSNAAMHWILRDESIRQSFLSDVYRMLKPDGRFVFEQGGAGNVSEIHSALISVLRHAFDIPLDRTHQADPWFFPSEKLMRQMLDKAGFFVEILESEYRSTQLNPDNADGTGGLEGWIKLLAAPFLDVLRSPQDKDELVKKVCENLDSVITHQEDGSQHLGYVRLRAVARKPS